MNEIDPSDKGAIKGIEHLCVVPAVIYADKVIVRSGAMRQIYIDLMMENMQTDKIPRAYWERKIAGLGLPKLDKVRSTRHPLMQATIKSLKPELQEGYERIVKAYREQGWGIYDDTPDVDRAVMVCDAYYGDGSSVVKLCEGAGRPIMIQEHEIGTLR